jgi:uncharacterized membrane protein
MARQELKDWVIMFHVGLAVEALLVLCFLYPTNGILVGAAIGAIPTILGVFHWFTQRDDKIKDAE